MLDESGKEMCRLLGKGADDSKGIVSTDQPPDAITILKQAIAADKVIPHPHQMEKPMDTRYDAGDSVHLHQRAFSVLELLQLALQENTYVTWGV